MDNAMCAPKSTAEPAMLSSMAELDKAIESVINTTSMIHEHLRVSRCEEAKSVGPPEPQPPLIGQRISFISSMAYKVRNVDSFLNDILAAVRDI
jgi:hypothetical protein